MTAQCCAGGRPPRPLARRLFGVAGSILPGVALALLPKCPLCLAAWLTIVTGIAVSGAAAARVHGLIVVFVFAGVLLTAARIVLGSHSFSARGLILESQPAGIASGASGPGHSMVTTTLARACPASTYRTASAACRKG